jgi:dihydrolipoamide dehydrogenase
MKKHFKSLIFISIIIIIGLFFFFNFNNYLNFEYLKTQQYLLQDLFYEHTYYFPLIFFLIYILITGLSIPGAAALTIIAGALFGFSMALILISFASTIGATIAFLLSRFLFKDLVQKKYSKTLKQINKKLRQEGIFYLFTLRMVPIFPFFLINILMGLTKMKTTTFFFVSQIGMLLGTMVYVYAGTQIATISSMSEILSPKIILSFSLIGLLPLLSNYIIKKLRCGKYCTKYRKPKHFDYNVIVIGGGSAGLVAANICAKANAKVALIEKNEMGGDCLNTGCIPSKTLLSAAKILSYQDKAKKLGFEKIKITHSFLGIKRRIRQAIKQIEPYDSKKRYEELGVKCFKGNGKIIDQYRIIIGKKILTTKNIIIATGASPNVPDIKGLEKIKFFTSDNIWEMKKLPKQFVILGGGSIGCELAQAFARLGSKVTIIQRSERIMKKEDNDVSELMQKTFEKEGIKILTNHNILNIEKTKKQKYVICENAGKQVKVKFNELLLALGRKPSSEGFGVQKIDINIHEKGQIITDKFMRTNYPNIYACGDVTSPYQFTHIAGTQAAYAAINALSAPFKKFKIKYKAIPWATFTEPEVARVGLSENEAQEKKIAYESTYYSFENLDRAITDNQKTGFIKVLTKINSDKILGVTIVGKNASDIIIEFTFAMNNDLGLNKILETIHIYPTFSEINKHVATKWKRERINPNFLKLLQIFYKFKRNKK